MCNTRSSMKVIRWRRIVSLPRVLIFAAVSGACSSGVPSGQRSLVRADAEAFESVVRSEMIDSVKESFGFLRVDARPAGDNAILTGAAEHPRGLDLDEADSISPTALARISEQRRDILSFLRVEEGQPVRYPGCGGTHTQRLKDSSEVLELPGCPSALRRYVNVGLPFRGAAPILTKIRRSEIPAPDSSDEHWTVLVTESSVGPGGENWRQYAWLFRRDRETKRLLVAEKYLLSWAE